MTNEIAVGSEVTVNDRRYVVLSFHKGFGNSPITANLRDMEDGTIRDVLKSDLEFERAEKLFSEFKKAMNGDNDNANLWKISEEKNNNPVGKKRRKI
jgi:hypothetical protein